MGHLNRTNSDIKNEFLEKSYHSSKNSHFFRTVGPSTDVNYDNCNIDLNFCKTSTSNTNIIKHHKESMSGLLEETFFRPPLWDDITSSIQNIDPENAIMLGGARTGYVKQETNNPVRDVERISSDPMLTILEVKSEPRELTPHEYISLPIPHQNPATPKISNTRFLSSFGSNNPLEHGR